MISAATPSRNKPISAPDLDVAVTAALQRIPPLWPLRHFVAVNPFLGFTDKTFAETCSVLDRVTGAPPLQSPADYLNAFRSGAICRADLDAVADSEWPAERLRAALESIRSRPRAPMATVADMLDETRPHAHWSTFVVEEISKWCAITFDDNQTTWNSPWKTEGLYRGWRDAARWDRNPQAFGLTGFRRFAAGLPENADDCIAHCMAVLAVPGDLVTDFLHRQLASIAGWAGYVQFLVREDAMRGISNAALRDLLAIRLAYDTALLRAFAVQPDWQIAAPPRSPEADQMAVLIRWQAAFERGYQRQLTESLLDQSAARPSRRPAFQAVFCIDVRSEVFRRHLEAASPQVATVGFAGFFGFPVSHQTSLGQRGTRCPVLLVPPIETVEPVGAADAEAIRVRQIEAGAWKAFQNSAASCFSFVETAGLTFAPGLGTADRAPAPVCARVAPDFADASDSQLADVAEGALRNMSLTENFARLVLFCGHGSESANNPYASALDCGACGGHAGDVNARLAAATLNRPAVRERLKTRGIAIPADTLFLAGLHHTGTDEVFLFDVERVPSSHAADVDALRSALAVAGSGARRERSTALGLADVPDEQLGAALRRRMRDASEVRPEWALANNAAFVAAPRSRTAKLRLGGRVFLHDYDAGADHDNRVLTLILSAPVVVASWINLQYYASRVDPVRYGSGSKVLHNVVGGVGVMEGNGGDLKVGLPFQSIHDGERFVHEPRRLSVFVEADRARIDAVLEAQAAVRQLVEHGWVHLFALGGGTCHHRTSSGWAEFG